MIRGGRLAVEKPGSREDRGTGADRGHDRDPLVHRPHPLEERAPFLWMIVGEQDARSTASGDHQKIDHLFEGLIAKIVRSNQWTVHAIHRCRRRSCCLRPALIGDEHHSNGYGGSPK
jgi:hypothetical protein